MIPPALYKELRKAVERYDEARDKYQPEKSEWHFWNGRSTGVEYALEVVGRHLRGKVARKVKR